ncbi:MAG: hypothetical protein HYY10_01950 [Candidatus Liptonbacteria bacterium]|nr:hypothetical protein [Candidatus Liptonbacteria bacterium]
MKEKLFAAVRHIRQKYPRGLMITAAVVFLVAAGVFVSLFMGEKNPTLAAETGESVAHAGGKAEDVTVAVAGADEFPAAGGGALGNSWPGEVISFGDIVVYPPRDGTIVAWGARIGQRVQKGQVLGKLSAAPSTIDRSMAVAEQLKDLIRAQTSRPVSVQLPEAEAQAAMAERDEARAIVALRARNLHTAAEEIFYRELRRLTDVINPQNQAYLRLKSFLAIANSQTRNDFEPVALQLRAILQKGEDDTLEAAMAAFLRVAERAVLDTVVSAEVSSEEIASLRDMVGGDKEKFVDALNMHKEARASLEVKEAALVQKSVSRDREVDAAAGDVKATEEAYANVLGSLTNGSIVAPRNGIISSISKNPGDFVTNDSVVAMLTAEGAGERFIRFRIPGGETLPRAGDAVAVVRPGFPLDRRPAKITGVGTALDGTGSYVAEASFAGATPWPVHASVRVIAPQKADVPVIKLSSIWWDEDGVSHVWGVSEAGRIFGRKIVAGRVFGAVIEVREGLKNGDRYIVDPVPGIREDMLLDDVAPENDDAGAPAMPAGHEHMEGMQM